MCQVYLIIQVYIDSGITGIMFLIGLFIHLVFLFSIFDIYFKSPIVNNANTYQPVHEALANRLVLFVVDGLRAESFVNYTTMPYLRSVANNHGRWGISHTRVPTESRPGHVAIIAGFYEDPSAIAKGWKENPVDFDSVFNQSEFTWAWGTYDILEIFTKGAVKNNIFVEKFDPYDQSFSSDKNTTLLDDWVFTRVKDFFHKAKYDEELRKKLHSKKIVFFLHLLGTDTSGHTHKPKTKNFLTTIKFVDENIREIEQIITDFYNDDGKTTFLMTSDHGMTDWGSHGTGDDDETKTPYVLWGAGVNQVKDAVQTLDPETHSMFYENRYDINQADLTPLMSTFLSIPVPVNSIGQLPSGLLQMSLPNKAKAIYSNCRQMISQYNKKRLDVEASAIPILYQPFKPFDGKRVQEIISFTEKLLEDEEYGKAIKLCEEIMHLSLSGLTYYHNYYQKPLLITVTFSFLGWIMCLLRFLVEQKMFAQAEMTRNKNQRLIHSSKTVDRLLKLLAVFASVLLAFLIYVQNLPVQYYIYFLMPIFLWLYALTPVNLWIQTLNLLKSKRRVYFLGIEILYYTLGSIALGLALTYRWVLSIPLLGMSLWPFFSASIHKLPKSVCVIWPIGCVLLSVFSFMSVIGKDTCIELVVSAGLIWLLIHSMYTWKFLLPKSDDQDVMREMVISFIQMFLLASSLQIVYMQSKRFEENLPISQTLQSMCWIISVLLPLIPLIYTKKFVNRLLGINTAILNFYLLLSVAHEGLFMVTMVLNVNCWMFIEYRLIDFRNIQIAECTFEEARSSKGEKHLVSIERSINGHDFRRAFFFGVFRYTLRALFSALTVEKFVPLWTDSRLPQYPREIYDVINRRHFCTVSTGVFETLYIILAYFGTGNIASLNSFEVRWVLCFTTSFRPFVITGLILLKTLSPFLSVACTFRAIQYLTKAPTGCLNIIVLIFSNIMGLHMLYHVRNTGSWLEIGTSISQYIIVQVITLFIVLINKIAKVLTEIEIHSLIIKLFKNRKKYV